MNQETFYLLRPAELFLKKKNQRQFVSVLQKNIRDHIAPLKHRFRHSAGRVYLNIPEDPDPKTTLQKLSRVCGLTSVHDSEELAADDLPGLKEALLRRARILRKERGDHFALSVRRINKNLPYSGYDYASLLGDFLRKELPSLKVNLDKPDWTLFTEFRKRAYVYGPGLPGPGGLPLGSSGTGLLLLSGGIDSPVAGHLLQKRGLKQGAVHFHTPPYTTDESLEKVRELAGRLALFSPGFSLYFVNFTPLQLRLKEHFPPSMLTLHSRNIMFKIAERIALQKKYSSLVTGESLGQVASQTLESLRYLNHSTELPILRPLIGQSKEDIIREARNLGSYEISVRPHPDACILFAAKHPVTRPQTSRALKEFESFPDADAQIEAAVSSAEEEIFSPS